MTKINVMDSSLANKIAAGEVIERIASIVKELIENSIDAGADSIKVILENSGILSLEVIDNGCGMDSSDAELCFLPHATSKIKKSDDLFFISSLGFRGEALASIASVSNIILKTFDGNESTCLTLSGGKMVSKTAGDGRVGSSVTVSDIFFNTPARLKFLKSEASELSFITSVIEKMSLAYPNVAFTLVNNSKTIIKTSGSDNLLKSIHEVFGLNVSDSMLTLNVESDDFYVSGYISKPEVMKSNKNFFIIFVNGRIIRNFEINKAVNDAYHTYKPVDKFPIVVLNIDIDPTMIDVNIHPSKQEVKISKMNELASLLYDACKKILSNTLLIPQMGKYENFEEDDYNDISSFGIVSSDDGDEKNFFSDKDDSVDIDSLVQTSFNFNEVVKVNNESDEEKEISISSLKLFPVGLVHGTYIVAQNDEGMFLVDQHAAAERINYELFLEKLKNRTYHMKPLLIPFNIELTKSDFINFCSKSSLFSEYGFDFDFFGTSSLVIKGHPDYFKEGYEEASIRKVLDIFLNSKYDRVKFLEHVSITLACKMSIKGNTAISLTEMQYFLDNIVKCENPFTCPHGRPTIIKYSKYDLEKLFKRSI